MEWQSNEEKFGARMKLRNIRRKLRLAEAKLEITAKPIRDRSCRRSYIDGDDEMHPPEMDEEMFIQEMNRPWRRV